MWLLQKERITLATHRTACLESQHWCSFTSRRNSERRWPLLPRVRLAEPQRLTVGPPLVGRERHVARGLCLRPRLVHRAAGQVQHVAHLHGVGDSSPIELRAAPVCSAQSCVDDAGVMATLARMYECSRRTVSGYTCDCHSVAGPGCKKVGRAAQDVGSYAPSG